MTRLETAKILALMITTYPNYKVNDMEFARDTWHEFLKDYEYTDISKSFAEYVRSDTSGFAPSAGRLIQGVGRAEKIAEDLSDLNEMEAWALVSKALRKSGYDYEKEFYKLPALVQKAVGTPLQLHNWSQTSIESVENVIQSNFCRTYRAVLENKKKFNDLPADMQDKVLEKIMQKNNQQLITTDMA